MIIRHLKQADAAAERRRSTSKFFSRQTEFSRPLTSIILKLDGDLNVTRLLSAAASVCLRSLLRWCYTTIDSTVTIKNVIKVTSGIK